MANMSFKKSSSTHCILLYQLGSRNVESRNFSEYESVTACIEGVINMFEEYFKALHPTQEEITYDLCSVLQFVDAVHDLSCLVYDRKLNMYAPYNKDWIKEKIFNQIRHQANGTD